MIVDRDFAGRRNAPREEEVDATLWARAQALAAEIEHKVIEEHTSLNDAFDAAGSELLKLGTNPKLMRLFAFKWVFGYELSRWLSVKEVGASKES